MGNVYLRIAANRLAEPKAAARVLMLADQHPRLARRLSDWACRHDVARFQKAMADMQRALNEARAKGRG